MKSSTCILLIMIIFLMALVAPAPGISQAKTQNLSPGDYAGRFRYSAYNMMVDDQKSGSTTSHIDIVRNTYVEGTIFLTVDKNGKIRPKVRITPDSVATYYIYTARITPINCSVTGYLEGETRMTIKPNSSSAFDPKSPSFSANFTLNNISPLSYSKMGINTDCPNVATRGFLVKGVNDQIGALNKYKVLKFNILRISEEGFSGDVYVPQYEKKLPTPGGFISDTDKEGFFSVYKIDLLAPLTDDDLAPLVSEWRTK